MAETPDPIASRLPSPRANPVLARARVAARKFAAAAQAPGTRRTYRGVARDFTRFCAAAGLAVTLDPPTIALYLADRGQRLAPATIRLRACPR